LIIDAPVDLIAGHDYILVTETLTGSAPSVILKDPEGKVVVTAVTSYPANGVEFRAQYSATYFIEYDSASVSAEVTSDCGGYLATRCRLTVGGVKEGIFQWYFDADAFKVHLTRDQTYTVSMTGHSAGDNTKSLTLMDRHGVVLSEVFTINDPLTTLTIHPSQTGVYYIQGLCGTVDYTSFTYTLTLEIN
jgi:hypothetical protein